MKMRLFIYLFISVFSFTKKDSFVCVPCFYDAGRFVVRSCVRSCICFFCFFWAVFLLHRVKKKRTTPPPSFFFFLFSVFTGSMDQVDYRGELRVCPNTTHSA